ncbi:hypothetical protein DL96DRAFT_1821768 [Flagelloscypha sp. PMI_526]|nr:hypothetical protein DL96DRAFT_1821768 [Flagelloscypha sp. PMI_526]
MFCDVIPFEILVLIIGMCPLYDILSLRKCCRLLYQASLDRGLWADRLAILCGGYDVPSLEVDLSIADSYDLEISTTRQHRLFSRLQVHYNPQPKRVFPRTLIKFHSEEPWRAICAGAGGRWVAAIRRSTLYILHLPLNSLSTESNAGLVVAAECSVPFDEDSLLHIYWTISSSLVTVLEVQESGGTITGRRSWLFVVRVSPSTGETTVLPTGNFDAQESVYSIIDMPSKPILCVRYDDPAAFVWCPEYQTQTAVDPFGMTDDYVIAARGVVLRFGASPETLTLWTYPREQCLHPGAQNIQMNLLAAFKREDMWDYPLETGTSIERSGPFILSPYSPLELTEPLAQFMLLIQDETLAGVRSVTLIRKAVFVHPSTLEASIRTLGTWTVDNFPSKRIPVMPYFSAYGDTWFLRWLHADCAERDRMDGTYVYGAVDGQPPRGGLLALEDDRGEPLNSTYSDLHCEMFSSKALVCNEKNIFLLDYIL